MKKLFNRSLMFQNIHSIKVQTIALGILFGIVAYFSINSNIQDSMYSVVNLNEYIEYSTSSGFCMFLMISFITLIFIFMKGINKRESMSFFMSGPFTKREIKKNEVLTLILLVLFFVAIYIYVIVCLSYKYKIQVEYIPDYCKYSFVGILRLLIAGILFSLYLAFMDLLFSNTIVSILAMVILPITMIEVVLVLLEVLLSDKIIRYVVNTGYKYAKCMFIYFIGDNNELVNNSYFSYSKILILGTAISILAIIILSVLIYMISDKIKVNNINNIFNFRIVELVSVQLILFSMIIQILAVIIQIKEYSISSRIVKLVFVIISFGISNVLRKSIVKKIDSYVN